MIGQFEFGTLDAVAFDLPSNISITANRFSVMVYTWIWTMRADASTNVWIWTECARGEKYSRFKKINWFYNNAVPFDSETLDFVHCPANRKLYIKADRTRAAGEGGVHIQLYAVGYAK
jgi:hypothetical protein